MITIETINHYLKNNGKPENKGYITKWSKEKGNFIALWKVEGLRKPTELELSEIHKKITDKEYILKRKLEYPEIGDQLDAIWKELNTRECLTSEADNMLNKIVSVKEKHPKKG